MKYIRILFFLLTLFVADNSINAQAPNYEWAKRFGSTGLDYGISMTTDNSGNVLATGYFEGTVDFDPGPGVTNLTAAGGSRDCFMLKLDSLGNLVWAYRIGGAVGDEKGLSIVADTSGDFCLLGVFSSTVDFNPGAGTYNLTASSQSIFVAKYNSSGNFIWAEQIANGSTGNSATMMSDNLGNLYIAGSASGTTTDFDPGPSTYFSSGSCLFLLKLSSSGNFIWVKQFGTTNVFHNALYIDASQNIFTVGQFQGTGDFDPGPGVTNLSSNGGYDGFMTKFDNGGNLVWTGSWGATQTDIGNDVVTDINGNAYVTGIFRDTVDFEPGAGTQNLISSGTWNAYVVKFSASNNLLWAGALVAGQSIGNSISIDHNQKIYSTGYFTSTIDLDPGPGVSNFNSTGGQDMYVSVLDETGSFVWGTNSPGTSVEESKSIHIDASGNIYLTGGFAGTTDFNPGPGINNLTTAGNYDVFISKWSPCVGTSSSLTVSSCSSYTLNSQTYTLSGTYTQTLTNSVGCDSVITLNLTIIPTPPAPGFITGAASSCQPIGSDIALTSGTPILGYNYNWSFVGNGAILGTSTTNTNTLTIDSSNILGTVEVYLTDLSNTCSGPSEFLNMGAGPFTPPTPSSFIQSTSQVCQNTNGVLYTITNDPEVGLYNWTYSGIGATITDNGDSAMVDFGINVTSGNICVVASNGMCNSVPLCIPVTVDPSYNLSTNLSICDEDSLVFGSQVLYIAGTYNELFNTVHGCDSNITLTLTINPLYNINLSDSICSGSTYTLGTQTLSTPGTYTETFSSINSCDSIVVLDLEIININTNVNQSGMVLTAMATGVTYQWINCTGNTIISGETNQSFTATSNGNYAVIINYNGCVDTSGCYPTSNAGINESQGNEILIYPNPVTEKLNLISSTPIQTINIITIDGKLKCTMGNPTAGTASIDLSEYSEGIYLIEITTEKGRVTKKIIKTE